MKVGLSCRGANIFVPRVGAYFGGNLGGVDGNFCWPEDR